MKNQAFRTVAIRLKPGHAAQAFDAMQLTAKNLKNIGLFLVKYVLSSYDKDYKIKPLSELHANQVEALAAANAAADACNKTRKDQNGIIPFESLPAKVSEQVRQYISAEFKSWTKALKFYRQNQRSSRASLRCPPIWAKTTGCQSRSSQALLAPSICRRSRE